MEIEQIIKILNEEIFNLSCCNLEKIIFSDKINCEYNKIIIRPIILKGVLNIQIEKFKDNKSFHENIKLLEENVKLINNSLINFLESFRQITIKKIGKDVIVKNKKSVFTIKEKENSLIERDLCHNKTKKYILKDGEKIEFLILLGIMSNDGKVLKRHYNKFVQINKYLEFIKDVIFELKNKKLVEDEISILDFGCGKSYLTFALYYYLENVLKLESFKIIGIDLKKDVISKCKNIAKELGYKKIKFINGDIKNYDESSKIDIVISLHACDNATDYAILKGLELNASAILSVPCCQHEFLKKINKTSPIFENMLPLANNGITLERFLSLATDCYRASSLQLCVYKTDIIEFIDLEHSPKNLLIKSIKSKKSIDKNILNSHKKFKEFLGINPMIDELISKYY